MYKQEKQYVVLAKDGKKIADAGLYKLSVIEKKIRIEYFLNTLPVCYGKEMECTVRYRIKGEVAVTQKWKEILDKSNSHYVFAVNPGKNIEEIVDCRLILQGGQVIVSNAKMSLAKADLQGMSKESNLKNEREDSKIRYIKDLDVLKDGNEEMQELYFNSFLLHGFYQYRYFVMGENFIGVPDHFYEREAIAARMMGFPYFMEAQFLEQCDLDGELRNELPKQGSFGYYLKKLKTVQEISLLRAEQQKGS